MAEIAKLASPTAAWSIRRTRRNGIAAGRARGELDDRGHALHSRLSPPWRLLAAAPGIAEAPSRPRDVGGRPVLHQVAAQRRDLNGERCIGVIADPCLKRPARSRPPDMDECADRELAVWDDILNETYRAGCATSSTTSRRSSCATCSAPGSSRATRPARSTATIYQGTIASPMGALLRRCARPRVARCFCSFFLDDAEGR